MICQPPGLGREKKLRKLDWSCGFQWGWGKGQVVAFSRGLQVRAAPPYTSLGFGLVQRVAGFSEADKSNGEQKRIVEVSSSPER